MRKWSDERIKSWVLNVKEVTKDKVIFNNNFVMEREVFEQKLRDLELYIDFDIYDFYKNSDCHYEVMKVYYNPYEDNFIIKLKVYYHGFCRWNGDWSDYRCPGGVVGKDCPCEYYVEPEEKEEIWMTKWQRK